MARLRARCSICPAVKTEEIRDLPNSVLFFPFFDIFIHLSLIIQLKFRLFWWWRRIVFRGSLAGTPAPRGIA